MMQSIMFSSVLLFVCLGSSLVVALVSFSRSAVRIAVHKERSLANQSKFFGKTHFKFCLCISCSGSTRKSSLSTSRPSMSLYAGASSADKSRKLSKSCPSCKGAGVCACVPCAGSGIDRVNGNIFERWTCNKCKGFGQVPCGCSGEKGLTPEQRGER